MSDAYLSESWHRAAVLYPRLQPHAEVRRQKFRGRVRYVVRDAASGKVHWFTPGVHACLGLMDGRRTLSGIWTEVVGRLGEEAPSQDDLLDLLSRLHGAGLLQSDRQPDLAELLTRHRRQERTLLFKKIGNPTSITIPLVDPDRFLAATIGLVAPLMGRLGMAVWTLVVPFALVLAALNWAELTDDISARALALENVALIALIFPVLKLLHELGHAYACKARGGPVHDMGVMLLVFLPVPYVDATSSALVPEKTARIGVAAAGMLVETFCAALAMFVWVLVEPGVIRAVAFNVMLIAGVSTVLFNINPLMRLDGYFMLSDALEIPNLGMRANRFWGWLVERHAFGRRVCAPSATAGERVWFLVYAPLSYIYRVTVMLGIALFVAQAFLVVGVLIAAWTLATSTVWPLIKQVHHVVAGPALARNRRRAVLVSGGALLAFLGLVLLVPAPHHAVAEGVVMLPGEATVRAKADGIFARFLTPSGTVVEPGAPLVELEDPILSAEQRVAQARVAALKARLLSEEFAARTEAALTRREIAIEQGALDRIDARLAELVVHAGTGGRFVVPRVGDQTGRFFRRGDEIGAIAPPAARTLRVIVSQADVDLVRERLRGASVKLVDNIRETYPARMVREVPAASHDLPSAALATTGGGSHAAETDGAGAGSEGALRSFERLFQFDLELPAEAGQAMTGGRAWVRFDLGSEPVGWQVYRRIRQIFLSHLET